MLLVTFNYCFLIHICIQAKPQTLEEWLESLRLLQYLDNFIDGGFADMSMISYVDVDVLKDMGVTSVLHQKVILNNCKLYNVK